MVPDKKAGDWKVKEPGKPAPTTAKAPTQGKAETVAKKQVDKAGGGQVVTHRPNGRIRDADTVAPGNESKTRDKKH